MNFNNCSIKQTSYFNNIHLKSTIKALDNKKFAYQLEPILNKLFKYGSYKNILIFKDLEKNITIKIFGYTGNYLLINLSNYIEPSKNIKAFMENLDKIDIEKIFFDMVQNIDKKTEIIEDYEADHKRIKKLIDNLINDNKDKISFNDSLDIKHFFSLPMTF